MKRFYCFLISIISLVIGLVVYVFVNHNTYLSEYILPLGNCPYISINPTIYTLIISFWADFMWAFALPFAIQGCLDLKKKEIPSLIICAILGFVVEIMQKLNFLKGTFDYYDLLVYFIATLLSIFIIYKRS